MSYKISPIKAFSDNYIWALHNASNAVIVDPGDAAPVIAFLQQKRLELNTILVTHHHWDHTDGIADLIAAFPKVEVYGPQNAKIANINHRLAEGDAFKLKHVNVSFTILATPGHTLDHIVYVNKDFIFSGDTLFSAGCGKMFEGTPEEFNTSLNKLAKLPAHTKVYCTHEYTQTNVKFALSVDNNNEALIEYAKWVEQQRKSNLITLPSTIAKECEINPFLRCHNTTIQHAIAQQNIVDADESLLNQATANSSAQREVDTFAKLRKLKDNF